MVTLVVVASVVTHLAGAGPMSSEMRMEATEASAGGALLLPPVLGPLGALVVLGLFRLLRRRALSPMWFVTLPPLGFGLQELAERLLHTESLPVVGAEPSLVATLLLQLAFAVVAFLLARLLRAALRRVSAFLGTMHGDRLHAPRTSTLWSLAAAPLATLPALAGEHFGRAPPRLR